MDMQWEKLLSSKRRKDKQKDLAQQNELSAFDITPPISTGRQELERDYDRILFAAPTRRLADKTQVFPLDRNDSVRTRLTHSHEVANFARGIGMRLAFEMKSEIFGELPAGLCVERDVPALLAAIGLAHDLGNPPFGHQGEASMRTWFARNLAPLIKEAPQTDIPDTTIFNDFLAFDGNSQTFRLLTKLQIINDKFGLNLTYATLAALIKYPRSSCTREAQHWKKHGFFYSEREVVDDVWQETGLREGVRHPFTWLMEACDDIAYSVLDAEDTVKKGLASYHDLINFLECWTSHSGNSTGDKDPLIAAVIEETEKKNAAYRDKLKELSPAELNDLHMQMFRVYAVSALINSVVEAFAQHKITLMQHSCQWTSLIDKSRGAQLCQALKEFDRTRGYRHRSVLELELRGSNHIQGVMDMLWVGIHGHKTKAEQKREKDLKETDVTFLARPSYDSDTPFGRFAYGRISENYRRIFEDPGNTLPVLYKEAQLLADAVSGMTDSYLMALHDELKSLYEYQDRLPSRSTETSH
ncbi:dNTP triphosphohydrolase [Cronobacter malonaticus]|uniref:dGTP triphosphohydrolase n=1 Tax=Cronobacter malonaticus TaxID=413503 RepID=UPI001A22D9D4|nr:dNTP triphosphohydrolase [Cronobacter malonaticus]MDI6459168.1 dNTP triphosphohydrolase [Cronobacter malonaticus]HAU5430081.1 dNTP triphosphohydrolase [Cronobacter malonaticus]